MFKTGLNPTEKKDGYWRDIIKQLADHLLSLEKNNTDVVEDKLTLQEIRQLDICIEKLLQFSNSEKNRIYLEDENSYMKIPCVITPKTEKSDEHKTETSSSSKKENLIHCKKDESPKSIKKFVLDEMYFRYPTARNLAYPTPQFNMALLSEHVNDLDPNVLKRKYEKMEPEAEAKVEEKQNLKPEYPKRKLTDSGQVVIIGPNNTEIPAHKFDTITWTSAATATRAVLINIFDDDMLSTHTLTEKPSPAFHDRQRPSKQRLDPLKINDIMHCIMMKCRCTEREIRAAITSKCADTAKKYKKRAQKFKK